MVERLERDMERQQKAHYFSKYRRKITYHLAEDAVIIPSLVWNRKPIIRLESMVSCVESI